MNCLVETMQARPLHNEPAQTQDRGDMVSARCSKQLVRSHCSFEEMLWLAEGTAKKPAAGCGQPQPESRQVRCSNPGLQLRLCCTNKTLSLQGGELQGKVAQSTIPVIVQQPHARLLPIAAKQLPGHMCDKVFAADTEWMQLVALSQLLQGC